MKITAVKTAAFMSVMLIASFLSLFVCIDVAFSQHGNDEEFDEWLDKKLNDIESGKSSGNILHEKIPETTGKHREDAIAMLSALRNHLASEPNTEASNIAEVGRKIKGIDNVIEGLHSHSNHNFANFLFGIVIGLLVGLGLFFGIRKIFPKEKEEDPPETIGDGVVKAKAGMLVLFLATPFILGCGQKKIEDDLVQHFHGQLMHSHQNGHTYHTHEPNRLSGLSNDRQTIEQLTSRVTSIADDILDHRSAISEHADQLDSLLDSIEGDGKATPAKISELRKRIKELESEVDTLTDELKLAKKRLEDRLQKAVSESYRRGYKQGVSE